MKKILIMMLLAATGMTSTAQETAVMPTIIVFPDDVWMTDHSYMETIDINGEEKSIPQYAKAFTENREIGTAIQAVQKVFEERNFEHEDLQNLLKSMAAEHAEEIANAADGDETEKGAMDELSQQARPDIRIDLDYATEPFGRMSNISFRLKAVDAYTSEQVASTEGTIQATTDPVDLALRKFIAQNCDEFCDQIVNYYLDLRENGRKINVYFRVAAGVNIDFLRDELGEDGDTYGDFLVDWVRKRALNKAAKKGRQTKNMVEVRSVRIPFFDEDGNPLEADDWAKGVRRAFREETGIKIVKGQGNTLGRVNFIVGAE